MFSMSFDLIQQLSDNMTNSPAALLAYIEFYHSKFSEEYEEVSFLIRNQSDVDMWVNEFWDGDPDSVNETNRLVRVWKVEQNWMSQDEFVDLAYLDVRDAVESTFVHDIVKRSLLELEYSLGNGMTYDELFIWHSYNPLARMEYLLEMNNRLLIL